MGYYSNPGFATRAFSATSKAGGSILNTLISRKTIPIFFIIMLISTLGSINESVKERSFVPVIVDIGGRLFNADALLYHKAASAKPTFSTEDVEQKSEAYKNAEGKERFFAWWEAIIARLARYWDIISFYFSILSSIYTFIMTYLIIVYFIDKANTSGKWFTWIFSGYVILSLGVSYGLVMYFAIDQNHCGVKNMDGALIATAKAVNPVKGIYYTITHYDEVFDPLIGAAKPFTPEPMESPDPFNTVNASAEAV